MARATASWAAAGWLSCGGRREGARGLFGAERLPRPSPAGRRVPRGWQAHWRFAAGRRLTRRGRRVVSRGVFIGRFQLALVCGQNGGQLVGRSLAVEFLLKADRAPTGPRPEARAAPRGGARSRAPCGQALQGARRVYGRGLPKVRRNTSSCRRCCRISRGCGWFPLERHVDSSVVGGPGAADLRVVNLLAVEPDGEGVVGTDQQSGLARRGTLQLGVPKAAVPLSRVEK